MILPSSINNMTDEGKAIYIKRILEHRAITYTPIYIMKGDSK